MAGGVSEGHGEASGRHSGGVSGRGVVILAEAWPGGGDGCSGYQSIYSALYYWLRVAVHLQPGQRRMDPSSLPFHGHSSSSTPLFHSLQFSSILEVLNTFHIAN